MKYFNIVLLLFPFLVFSQFSYTISGTIKDNFGGVLSGANITLDKEGKYGVSDENGNFTIQNLQKGIYQIKISFVGFQTFIRTIKISSENVYLDIALVEKVEDLDDIIIISKTASKKQTERAITISSLDVKKLQNQSLGAEEVLKGGTGVVVRQSGGLGSNLSISLNGLTGNAVPIFYDGIPLELLGNGVQVNTIPVDALQRLDIYKGVVPIDIGTDALGGAINLVPLQQNKEYFRISYSGGSFNTHRITFNGLKKINKKISLSANSYFNYSDNDYVMRNIRNLIEIELADGSTGVDEEVIDARRFHDRHISGYLETKLSVTNVTWADRFEFVSSYAKQKDEIQLGAFIDNTAVGEAEVENDALVQRIDYKKSFLRGKLKARYYGVFSFAVDKLNDSTTNVFNWRGEILSFRNTSGAELSGNPTLRRRERLGTAHRLILDYSISDNINIKVSDFYRYNRVQGVEPITDSHLPLNGVLIDPNTIPSTVNRNIFGAELQGNFFNDKLDVVTFFKNYDYKASAIDIFSQNPTTVLPIIETQNNINGYGFALKYKILPSLFVRTSFEQTIRIPTETEIFGDLRTVVPNFGIQPEESLNWNAGLQFNKQLNSKLFALSINGFIRDQSNLIRPVQVTADNIRFENEASVDGKGIEFAVKTIPIKNLSLTGNFTFQSNLIGAGINSSISQSTEVPNIPTRFYNLGGAYTINNIFELENDLKFSWNYSFVDRFSINTVLDIDTANPDFIIPEQNVHNAALTYIINKKGLAFSFNLRNVFNSEVFDNFRIPRPGINYAFKINYSL